MKSNTVFYILESCSAHHFVKLFLAILWSDNQEAAMKILQVTKLGHGILYVCGMFHLEKAIRHLAFVEPNDIHGSCPVCQVVVLKIWYVGS